MEETINVLIEQLKKVNAENEKLKFRLSNVMLSLPSDEIAQKANEWYKDIDEYNAFIKGAAWTGIRLIDEFERGNGA